MGRSLSLHKRRDGTVTVKGEFPETLLLSTRYVAPDAGDRAGVADVYVVFNLANGRAVYKVVRGEWSHERFDDPAHPPTITGYHLALLRPDEGEVGLDG